ncbi:hypothetical protein [Kitasatospora kifunensis]|uniref:Secreted protein n=1 Tax=Kitasatospora kifunensis TaxID=58351 RepID=A0A7W7QZ42_KITKI|nr:hypothetical protein [Kitasatospora kifunensis]MBB4922477.1 hypothetical protein [Kitasatospora kifunensis]
MRLRQAFSALAGTMLAVTAATVPASATVLPHTLRAPGATLAGANFSIHMDHDQKDRDTLVTVTIRDLNGNTAARISSTFGQWDQYSDQGPFQLAILNHTSWELLKGSQTTLRIDPHGNNHIEPNLYVDLVFSDGTHLSSDCPQLDLDQESRQIACGIS